MMRLLPLVVSLFLPLSLAACNTDQGDTLEPEPVWFTMDDAALPAARWDHQPMGKLWTRTAIGDLVSGAGMPLINMVPKDIDAWCPAYPKQDQIGRASFWTGLLSAMAKHESTYNEQAVGGGGRWFGLVQISPATAKHYGCGATTGGALKNGVNNLQCAITIMATTVPRDGVVAAGGKGVAADWGPFHSAAKRADMQDWVSSQAYCRR